MNNFLKTASIVTSGVIVGAIVRKYAHFNENMGKKTWSKAAKEINKFLRRDQRTEDINNYFI